MAATEFQAEVLKRIARSRIDGGTTCVAGGLALNHVLGTPRLSRDIGCIGGAWPRIAGS